jgi:hypothetical protein
MMGGAALAAAIGSNKGVFFKTNKYSAQRKSLLSPSDGSGSASAPKQKKKKKRLSASPAPVSNGYNNTLG